VIVAQRPSNSFFDNSRTLDNFRGIGAFSAKKIPTIVCSDPGLLNALTGSGNRRE
jgi:hypothetical protein